ncbi:Rpn family recombination-promoting nuclease/putative transposase [Cyclobacterium salsum]|uniref:Rpn family recombination-promoting nuclease/putative transposase n=1 Tax=Cyclobacterium salsum TaxID=2666329 RepID=UPI001390A9A6|nr:Rpn family recombination-promoting nuclease/putative transposase [Cyclobacterium salsum]
MAKRYHNIHDAFVRESFSDAERAVAFLECFLPEKLVKHINFESLTVLKETYINEALKEHFSDLVFEVSLKSDNSVKTDVVLLFEHKSSPDRNVLFQVGYYMFAHWTKCLTENKEPKPIIPIIYYQGKKNWKVGNLSDLFKNYPEEIRNYMPTLNPIFIDLKTISKDQLMEMRNNLMGAAILAQQWRINPTKLKEDFERIFRLLPIEDTKMNFLEMIVVYALNVSEITEAQLGETIKSIPEPLKEKIMTTYTMLIEKGIQKGKIEEKNEVIVSLFDEGFETAKIAKIVKLSEEKVVAILKDKEKLK